MQNKVDKVKELLSQGANPNTKDYTGWTPLVKRNYPYDSEQIFNEFFFQSEAVSYEFEEIVNMLLQAGADPNIKGIECKTALHEAVQVNNVSLVELLLKFKANPEIKDQSGKKPL